MLGASAGVVLSDCSRSDQENVSLVNDDALKYAQIADFKKSHFTEIHHTNL